ncbi:MAG TPA: hypothetical protein VII12_10115, partial [Thermoanaerobaculia bacterium]
MLDPNAAEVPPVVPEGPAENVLLAGVGVPVSPRGEESDVGVLYEQYRELLLHVACRKFRVPDSDAENLMQEV